MNVIVLYWSNFKTISRSGDRKLYFYQGLETGVSTNDSRKMCIVLVVLRDLGDKGNVIAVAQLLSRRDKIFNHRAAGVWNGASHGTTARIGEYEPRV